MEFLQEPTFTAFLALILSFLVAKIVSFAVSNSRTDGKTVVSSVNEDGVQKGVVVDRLSRVKSGKGKKRVKFVDDFVIKRVDRYEGSENIVLLDDVEEQSVGEKAAERVDQEHGVSEDLRRMVEQQRFDAQVKGFEKDEMGIEKKADDDAKMRGILGENEKILETSWAKNASPEDQKNELKFEGDALDTSGVKSVIVENQKNEVEFEGDALDTSGVKSVIVENQRKELKFEGDDMIIDQKEGNGEEGIVENEGKNKGEVEEEGRVSIESDDDWEGIERSELEKVFAEAVNYVEYGGKGKEKVDDRLAKLGSDVQMELFGLHKVAVEGPCHEPQPMALKVAARAKWNAWQRLGSMSQEMAMEQYIRVLSDSIPGWMHDYSADDAPKSERISETSDPKYERILGPSATPVDDSSAG
ncbi:hypothetical protein CDL12_05189 [Handroanthus impetiginosus]|uniref:ACB domain-containing protein n=1 Tax=Handroanthus impetiginosus TaxID=429701 RepID=A0A2G9HX71_9LAMI|nr:hypothetical protein CDL12_05189 [Handroanthus impetiginosus]